MHQAPLPRRWFHVVFLAIIVAPLATAFALAAETIPPVPRDHFNDYANVVSSAVERQLNDRLTAFEHTNSSQVVVAIFPRMRSTAPVKDYTLRVAQAWGVGQKDRDNGIVLFAFMEERQLYLQVGTGLESRVPDSLAQQIIDRRIVPRFRAHDIDGGLRDGVDAILAAIRPAPPPAAATAAPAQIPVEAASPPAPRHVPPPPNPPPSSTTRFNGGGGAGGGIGGFVGFVFLVSFIAIIAAGIRAIGGSGANDYDSAASRTPPPLFFGRRPDASPRPRLGGFGGFGSTGGFGGRSSSRGSFSRGGGGFRGGGAGGKW